MPSLTRWFVRTSLLYLILALIVGVLLVLQSLPAWLASIFPVYVHLLVFGWLTQLIFGIAFWMFPKYPLERSRGSLLLGWTTYGLLNLGLLLRMVAEPLNSLSMGGVWGWTLVVSAVLQWLAGMTFVLNTWARVRVR